MCLLAYLIPFKTESQEGSIGTERCDPSAQILARKSIFLTKTMEKLSRNK